MNPDTVRKIGSKQLNANTPPFRAIAFDFGLKYIGVAIGQTITDSARPLATLRAQDGTPRWDEIQKLLTTWQPNILVVGVPLNMDGGDQHVTHAARQFAKQLSTRYHLPVQMIDERLTTVAAKAEIFATKGYKGLRKEAIDSMAAVLILEDWLQSQK